MTAFFLPVPFYRWQGGETKVEIALPWPCRRSSKRSGCSPFRPGIQCWQIPARHIDLLGPGAQDGTYLQGEAFWVDSATSLEHSCVRKTGAAQPHRRTLLFHSIPSIITGRCTSQLIAGTRIDFAAGAVAGRHSFAAFCTGYCILSTLLPWLALPRFAPHRTPWLSSFSNLPRRRPRRLMWP
jgi:hypothetical protein